MRPINYLITAVILMLFLFGCEGIQNPHQKIEDIVERIPDVELIPGAENTTLTVKRDGVYSYFRISVENVERNLKIIDGSYYGWCLQLGIPINLGEEYTGVRLYSTERDTWINRVSYIINNRQELERTNPGLSWREIQVAIWVMMETRNYELERVAEHLPSSVNGYNPEIVNTILRDVKQNGRDFKPGYGDRHIIITNDEVKTKQLCVIEGDKLGPEVFDVDGNEYRSVKIGNLYWMAENLRTTKYHDGTPDGIPIEADRIWAYDYENSGTYYVDICYGYLYNWHAVNNHNVAGNENKTLCPAGWHVPSDDEWKQLEIALGMTDADLSGWRGTDENVGGQMKCMWEEDDPRDHPRWDSPNEGANNSSGFSGLPGGMVLDYGPPWDPNYDFIGVGGFWWSSTSGSSIGNAWTRTLMYSQTGVSRGTHSTGITGLSVRCVKPVTSP